MALFPRRIGGRYAMIGRRDNENLYLIYSDDLYSVGRWSIPFFSRISLDIVQHSAIVAHHRIDDCWLLLDNGLVGPEIFDWGRSHRQAGPLKTSALRVSSGSSRAHRTRGYVPTSSILGGDASGDQIILPYAVSDTFSNFATSRSRLMETVRELMGGFTG